MGYAETRYNIERNPEIKEQEPDVRVPLVDIVRHGDTDYKELRDPSFKFDPQALDFKLDAEHLDLNEQGIENILQTAMQLCQSIDKEKEVVMLVSSPNYRAQSSILLIEKILQENGIDVLNSSAAKQAGASKGIRLVGNLRQIEQRDSNFNPTWSAEDKKYREEDPQRQKISAREAHTEIAARLGKTVPEIFTRDHDQLDLDFRKWLRHMINIDQNFDEKTKKVIAGRRIRLICATHEEVPEKFMQEALGVEGNLAKGQVMEINAQNKLSPGEKTAAQVSLFEKGEARGAQGKISISYDKKE
ncbi:MAG: hypothetical protein WCV50_04555 [Patescibacteria group bacterium]|jgi:broad specificity phosphatase PhoE